MINPKDYLEFGQKFHGHKCPAMPMGLRVGAAAMNALGVERAKDGQLVAMIELGDDHCATCFADGIQVITGCTFGKGNIKKLNYGKWGLTLIDRQSGRAIRVVPKAEAMMISKKSEFMQNYRRKGIPASQVPNSVVEPLIDLVMNAPEEQLLSIGEIFTQELPAKKESFESFVCDICGEMTVEGYGRILGDKKVCQPCYDKHRL
ncbi:MAG TPA: tRNA CCA-pyrophosphorylase [Candidatus Aminicenantes bacterium]|nr:MAG: tRNA CCA-pyrophosphorylase [Candidatus Aminicenantes bacterium]HEK86716.1 tRNA CCA-pyrophosphorylase [Candidatus Aminicenantes bacterium]